MSYRACAKKQHLPQSFRRSQRWSALSQIALRIDLSPTEKDGFEVARGREREGKGVRERLNLPRETGVPGEKVSVKPPRGGPLAFAKGCKSDKTPPLRARPRRSVTWRRANRARGHFLVFVLRLRRLIANYIPPPSAAISDGCPIAAILRDRGDFRRAQT